MFLDESSSSIFYDQLWFSDWTSSCYLLLTKLNCVSALTRSVQFRKLKPSSTNCTLTKSLLSFLALGSSALQSGYGNDLPLSST